MKTLVFAVALVFLISASASAAGLNLVITDGKVTLDADSVTIRQILTEWARIGKTQIVNLDRVTSMPVTMKLDGVPEAQALDIILRSVPGYMAAPRPVRSRDASIYDRILIMATTTTVAPRPSGAAGPSSNVTQLRNGPQVNPGFLEPETMPESIDPAVAAAAAAGLVPVPAPSPATIDPRLRAPLPPGYPTPPGYPSQPGAQLPGAPNGAPTSAAPPNFWNAPAGTAQPTLAPPQPLPQPNRPLTAIPPQPDR